MQSDSIKPGQTVIVVDDLIATGPIPHISLPGPTNRVLQEDPPGRQAS